MAILSISDLKALVQNTIYNNATNDIQGEDVQVALINAIDTLDSLEGFVNVHKANGQTTITTYGSKAAARAAVPTDAHFEGVVIAYKLSTGWIIEQNLDTTAGTWNNDASWQTIFPQLGGMLIENTNTDKSVPAVNIDTTARKLQFLGLAPKLIINNKIYVLSQTEVSLSEGISRQLFVVFNISNETFSVLSYQSGLVIPANCALIAVIFVDVAGQFTQVLNVSCAFDYTVDGKNPALDKLEKDVNSKGNVILVYDDNEPPTMPNFNTTNMTFSLSENGGAFFIGNKGYSLPNVEGRTISLLGVNSTVILLVYNLSSHAISAKAYNATLYDDDVVFAVVRVDQANTPTKITAVSCAFDYTIDGTTQAESQTIYQNNIIYVQDNQEPTLLVNIDTSNWQLQFSSNGGQIWIGKDRYQLPNGDARNVTLSGINSTLIKVLYDTQTSAITAHAYNEVINSIKKILLCVIRTDAANTPTKLLRCDAVFDYTIDGKNKDKDIRELQDNTKILNSLYPYMDIFKSIPATEINTEFQSMCKVGDEFWIATGGSGKGGLAELAGYIHRYNSNWEYIDKIEQQGFHFNSMDYDADTDRLITGEAGEGSNEVYIFGNVSQWPTTHASTPITSADIERVIVVSQVNNRPNPVWAERNALGHRDMIISANLNTKFLKIKLGYGTNQLQYGVYTASSANVPNGTYAIEWNYSLTIPALINQIGQLLPYSATVCQDIAYYKGKIYTMTGAVPTTLMELTITDKGIIPRVIHQLWGDDSGNVISNCANEGIICKDGKIYCGISAIGMDTSITQYNNKIVVFDM